MNFQLYSPAKINLNLRVLGKRPDGYHELSSLFQTVSLFDILAFQTAEVDSFTCSDPNLSTDQSNLVMKALYLFRKKTELNFHLEIHLEKNIPSQAGLGGGSSNAATTLWACNELTGKKYSNQQLQDWSSEIGSDIPFFFSQGTAHCTGRGEKVKNLPPMKSPKIYIFKPDIGLSTPKVYGRFQQGHHDHSLEYFNDLEAPAFAVTPALKELKQHLLSLGFTIVLMSGSGSSFFCIGEGILPPSAGLQIFPVNYVNRQIDEWYS